MNDLVALGVFCSDAREEVGGTVTLVGIYPDNINVPVVPGTMGQLMLYARIALRTDQPSPPPMRLVLISPTNEERELTVLDAPFIENAIAGAKSSGNDLTALVTRTGFNQLQVKAAGHLRAVIRIEGRPDQTIASLQFKINPPAKA